MIYSLVTTFLSLPGINAISAAEASAPSMEGLALFESPLVGYASANDKIFSRFRDEGEITHGRFIPPGKWLKDAKTVVSVFLPFSRRIVESNAQDPLFPSQEWLHGRFEGQQRIDALSRHLVTALNAKGYRAVAPSLEPDYRIFIGTWDCPDGTPDNSSYGSTWSERHVAFAAGLGTFGLSRNLITDRGVAGRFTSIVTDMPHAPTPRCYSDPYEYCLSCGACILTCPVQAIGEQGKEHTPCSAYLDQILERTGMRYGCGKCQVDVPCSTSRP